jgi:Protein of unknown function (DUF3158)
MRGDRATRQPIHPREWLVEGTFVTSFTPTLFQPVTPTDFIALEQAASLKGLLRPFKSKGELNAWANQCEQQRDGLAHLAQRLLSQATAYPLNLLPVVLAQQSTSAGTTFLRWRNADRSAMGVALWARQIGHSSTPPALARELYALELERIVLNMQISLLHTLARQARECAHKMSAAEAAYQQRTGRIASLTHKE